MIKDLRKFERDLKNTVTWILEEMPHSKKRVLINALERNFELTSSWILEHGTLTCYKEGWYITLQGTRCSFSVWADDNDGELVFHRKPNESKLHKLWEYDLHFGEGDFFRFSNNNEQEEQEIETMENTYVTYEEPLKGRCFTEKQMHEVYRDMANKTEYPSFDIWFTDMIKSGVFERVIITAHTYVCELPETIQSQILQECKETFESLAFPVDIQEQIETVKGCKMCDLEDTINVLKYYTK